MSEQHKPMPNEGEGRREYISKKSEVGRERARFSGGEDRSKKNEQGNEQNEIEEVEFDTEAGENTKRLDDITSESEIQKALKRLEPEKKEARKKERISEREVVFRGENVPRSDARLMKKPLREICFYDPDHPDRLVRKEARHLVGGDEVIKSEEYHYADNGALESIDTMDSHGKLLTRRQFLYEQGKNGKPLLQDEISQTARKGKMETTTYTKYTRDANGRIEWAAIYNGELKDSAELPEGEIQKPNVLERYFYQGLQSSATAEALNTDLNDPKPELIKAHGGKINQELYAVYFKYDNQGNITRETKVTNTYPSHSDDGQVVRRTEEIMYNNTYTKGDTEQQLSEAA